MKGGGGEDDVDEEEGGEILPIGGAASSDLGGGDRMMMKSCNLPPAGADRGRGRGGNRSLQRRSTGGGGVRGVAVGESGKGCYQIYGEGKFCHIGG